MSSEADVRCIAMTGICAGRRGDVSLGDVIFADRLWSYDAGKKSVKSGVERFQGDQIQYSIPKTIHQRMQDLKIDETSWPIQRPELPGSPPFKIHVAPIGTGAAVVQDKNIFDYLSDDGMRKVLGIDMEASALGAIGSFIGIPAIVAKAVSDFADDDKDDRFRHFASQASAQCMVQLLKNCADLIVKEDSCNSVISESYSDEDLIGFLAEEYPEPINARTVWRKAGGSNGDVANFSRPKDMWNDLWRRSCNGAIVTPSNLVQELVKDYPENPILKFYLQKICIEN